MSLMHHTSAHSGASYIIKWIRGSLASTTGARQRVYLLQMKTPMMTPEMMRMARMPPTTGAMIVMYLPCPGAFVNGLLYPALPYNFQRGGMLHGYV